MTGNWTELWVNAVTPHAVAARTHGLCTCGTYTLNHVTLTRVQPRPMILDCRAWRVVVSRTLAVFVGSVLMRRGRLPPRGRVRMILLYYDPSLSRGVHNPRSPGGGWQ